MAYGTVNADIIQSSVAGVSLGAGNASIMKNRIINGAMVIDQRNAGASVATTSTGVNVYSLDRWLYNVSQASKFTIQQNAGSVTPPVGFSNYLGCTSTSAYTVGSSENFLIGQLIEGFNTSDLGWGTASAKTVTLSFQVYSSLTGTFGGAILNSAFSRSYPFTYSIPVANTWTTISVTIAGDTTGTWIGGTNGIGMRVYFGLGVGASSSGTAGSWAGSAYLSATGATSVVGTNGATFYITGVQLEVGTSATGFEYRQYGQELALCQRYYFRYTNNTGSSATVANLQAYSTSAVWGKIMDLPVSMRTNPTTYNNSGALTPNNAGGGVTTTFTGGTLDKSTNQFLGTVGLTGSSGLVAGNSSVILLANNGYLEASAEL